MSDEPKPLTHEEELAKANADYTRLCAEIGDLETKKKSIEYQIRQRHKTIFEMSKKLSDAAK